ncbi:phosphotransferase family protein [Cupriavidus basilensis]
MRLSLKSSGVLDWELSTLGHPLADFAYHCMSWHIPASLWRGIGGLDLDLLGIPCRIALCGSVCAVHRPKGGGSLGFLHGL